MACNKKQQPNYHITTQTNFTMPISHEYVKLHYIPTQHSYNLFTFFFLQKEIGKKKIKVGAEEHCRNPAQNIDAQPANPVAISLPHYTAVTTAIPTTPSMASSDSRLLSQVPPLRSHNSCLVSVKLRQPLTTCHGAPLSDTTTSFQISDRPARCSAAVSMR
ncbi:hypothetical protein RYX36_013815 [Vicia faba]